MRVRTLIFIFVMAAAAGRIAAAPNEIIGQWSLTLPTDEAGWLNIRQNGGAVTAELMWAVGAARPLERIEVGDGTLSFTRAIRRPLAPKEESATRYRITMRAKGDVLRCTMRPEPDGKPVEFLGKRQPPMPPRPDLSRVKFGEPVTLFNGRDLGGWRVSNPAKRNGWSVRDGILSNDTPKTDFGSYGEYANLRTDAEFEDFQLQLEYRLPAGVGGNSGIYLRGLYEVQVTHRDSKMQGINGPGAVFGRITPSRNAGKPAGEWESFQITLVDRHVTVVLNGDKVIDNAPVEGCTGGALKSDVTAPGPIYLQGDHTAVQYRNIVLRPVRPDR
ncbi:MAG: DUF1080 domain-containing protein [Opitutaceae bacterium]|nr:DUF1080 domain-containing protein [Opitutaceae bacterium]